MPQAVKPLMSAAFESQKLVPAEESRPVGDQDDLKLFNSKASSRKRHKKKNKQTKRGNGMKELVNNAEGREVGSGFEIGDGKELGKRLCCCGLVCSPLEAAWRKYLTLRRLWMAAVCLGF
jgi:hypothetical protein